MFPTLQAQRPEEFTPEYAARVLRAILADPLHLAIRSIPDLEHADRAAQRFVAGIPAKPEPHQATVLETLHQVRLQIAGVITRKRKQQKEAGDRFLDWLYLPRPGSGGGSKTGLIPPTPTLPPTPTYAVQEAVQRAREAELTGVGAPPRIRDIDF